jgi:hypothetical protein
VTAHHAALTQPTSTMHLLTAVQPLHLFTVTSRPSFPDGYETRLLLSRGKGHCDPGVTPPAHADGAGPWLAQVARHSHDCAAWQDRHKTPPTTSKASAAPKTSSKTRSRKSVAEAALAQEQKCAMAYAFYKGTQGFEKNEDRALSLFQEAADEVHMLYSIHVLPHLTWWWSPCAPLCRPCV